MSSWTIRAMEQGWIPEILIRLGIRQLCRQRLGEILHRDLEARMKAKRDYIGMLRSSPLAVETKAANEQHYEIPAGFFHLVLGRNRKYSSCFFENGSRSLDQAEDAALRITMERAELRDGQTILELGCGWGSLTLAMARRFPRAKIVAISNSSSQREWIESQAKAEGLSGVTILTRNMVEVRDLDREFGAFDRVVSVEMFEHMRNYERLFQRIAGWMKPDAKLFVHIFTHREMSYLFETEGEDNWMGKYFFTGGQMPSQDLFLEFQQDLRLEEQWAWSGRHYAETSERWLQNLDRNRGEVLRIFEGVYGKEQAPVWVQRWRVFFMACAELFNFDHGREWGVTHYRFKNRKTGGTP
ncbi:MAG: class I SAM-dependent methyltransferase [Proteobacteria bacterium]|nr:class I SAM-dependent methyltransferase [Pseudomonadota bacterium]